MITDEQLNKVIEHLQGTCGTLGNSIAEVTEDDSLDDFCLTSSQLDQVDNEIFECTTCGWWCEMSEACFEFEHDHVENTCEDCCDIEED